VGAVSILLAALLLGVRSATIFLNSKKKHT